MYVCMYICIVCIKVNFEFCMFVSCAVFKVLQHVGIVFCQVHIICNCF